MKSSEMSGVINREDIKLNIVSVMKKNHIHAVIQNWFNFMETVESPGAVVINIDSTEQAIQAMKIIHEQFNSDLDIPLSIRAVAGWKDKTYACCLVRFFSNAFSGPTDWYNESYTANPSGVADIIFRFSPEFQKNKLKMIEEDVQIPAGLQMEKLESFLTKKKRSIPTATMINKVSCVGAVMNGCQGTGRDQPTLSGLVESLTILKPNGEVVALSRGDEHFDTLIGANLGLTGIVLDMKLRTVPQFKLREEVTHFTNLDDLNKDLAEWLQHDYFTIMLTPLYGHQPFDDTYIPNIQVRVWDKTDDKVTESRDVHDYTVEDLAMEISTKAGGEVQNFLLRAGLPDVLEAFIALTAIIIAKQRGEKVRVATANNMMHYQRAFPRDLDVVSFQLSVPETEASDRLYQILSYSEEVLAEMNNEEDQFIPVTFSTYVRYIDGTSGGLSTCPSEEGHKVLIVEYVTNSNAPGFDAFIARMVDFYHKHEWYPKFHLGKGLPITLEQFIDEDMLSEFDAALVDWYGGDAQRAYSKNPMFSPFLKQQFGLELNDEEEALLSQDSDFERPYDEDVIKFLKKLVSAMEHRHCSCDEEKNSIKQFCQVCYETIDKLNAKELSESSESVSASF